MNLLRPENVLALFWIFLLFRYNQVASTSLSTIMDDNVELCKSSCCKSIKSIIANIIELKEEVKANRELTQKLLDLSDYMEHIKSLNQHIEELRKTNGILRESFQRQNHKVIVKDLNESNTHQNSLKDESNRIEMEERYKFDMENVKKEKDRAVNELEAKLSKELADRKTKEENLNNEIKEMKSQVSSLKKQLEQSQSQLTNKNILVESNSLKIRTIEKDLVECNERFPKTSCQGLPSGIYRISIPELDQFYALCNGDIDNGGWIVIQKRFNGSEDFYRNWIEYRNGFGILEGEFFIGLEFLHRITNSQRYELYIQMEHFNGRVEFARYNNFRIGNENEKYELQSIGDFSGTESNVLAFDLNGKFSTYDQDNGLGETNWAERFHGGWWYKVYLGAYYNSNIYKVDSMNWNKYDSLKSVQMLIRPSFN